MNKKECEKEQEKLILKGIRPKDYPKCLDIALQNRNLEIGLLWQRAWLFWGFIAVLLVAIAESKTTNPHLALVLSLMGVMFSIIWVFVNRASKSWQESWEIKVAVFSKAAYRAGYLFDRAVLFSEEANILSPVRYSVSKLLIALSWYAFAFWSCLSAYLTFNFINFSSINFFAGPAAYLSKDLAVAVFILFTVAYIGFVLRKCRSGDKSILEKSAEETP